MVWRPPQVYNGNPYIKMAVTFSEKRPWMRSIVSIRENEIQRKPIWGTHNIWWNIWIFQSTQQLRSYSTYHKPCALFALFCFLLVILAVLVRFICLCLTSLRLFIVMRLAQWQWSWKMLATWSVQKSPTLRLIRDVLQISCRSRE